MSPVVKNLRRCSPRARWKIEAPCMIVLSTSKNAAAVVSGAVLRASSISAADAADWPASRERDCRLRGWSGVDSRDMQPRLTSSHARDLWLTQSVTVNVSDYLREAAAHNPDGIALVEHRGDRRELSWRQFD